MGGVGLRVAAALVLLVLRGWARFGYVHNEIPRVIPPVCQGPVVKRASRGCRTRWVGVVVGG